MRPMAASMNRIWQHLLVLYLLQIGKHAVLLSFQCILTKQTCEVTKVPVNYLCADPVVYGMRGIVLSFPTITGYLKTPGRQ